MGETRDRSIPVSFNLRASLLEEIERLAQARGVSRSDVVAEAVADLLEDADDAEVSSQRLADSDDPLLPWEQAKSEAGL